MTLILSGTDGLSDVDGTAAAPAIRGTDANTGIFFPAADTIAFAEGGAEAMRIDSDGDLLVGGTSTTAKLAVKNNTNDGTSSSKQYAVFGVDTTYLNSDASAAFGSGLGEVQIQNGTSTRPAMLSLGGSLATGEPLGAINFFRSGNTATYRSRAQIASVVSSTGTANQHGGDLRFYTAADGGTNPTERARIESGGNINLNSVVYNNTTVNAANMFLNSGPTHQIYRSTSSIRYKTNVETIEDSYSAALLQCRPVWFRSLCGGDNKEHGYWGFIAEEVAAIDPRLVFWTTTETTQNENGESTTVDLETPIVEGVQYDRFVPHLLNLIKKQNETITALTTRITALEGAGA